MNLRILHFLRLKCHEIILSKLYMHHVHMCLCDQWSYVIRGSEPSIMDFRLCHLNFLYETLVESI